MDPVPTTVEEVERSLGLEPGSLRRPMDGCCHYNPSKEDDPSQDCMAPSAWHARSMDGHMFQPCERHMGIFLAHYRPIVVEFHRFGSACSVGENESWWVNGGTEFNSGDSLCVLTETGVELGLLELVDD